MSEHEVTITLDVEELEIILNVMEPWVLVLKADPRPTDDTDTIELYERLSKKYDEIHDEIMRRVL